MQWIYIGAGAEVCLACAAAGVFLAVALFGDRFLKSDEALRKAMDAVMYLMLAALTVMALMVAVLTYRVCPLTPSAGICYNMLRNFKEGGKDWN